MRVTKIACALGLITAVSTLSGCYAMLQVECKQGERCSAKGTVGTGEKPSDGGVINNALLEAIATTSTSGSIDLSSLYIDVTGTTFALPSTGLAVLSVKNAAGALLGSRSFAWSRTGTQLVFQDRASVEAWLAGFGSAAASLDYDIDQGPTPTSSSQQTIASALYYQGQLQAASQATFLPGSGRIHCPVLGCGGGGF